MGDVSAAGPPRPPVSPKAPTQPRAVSPPAPPVTPRGGVTAPVVLPTPRQPAAATGEDEAAWDAPTQVKREESDPDATAPRPALQQPTLTTEMREQIWAIVRAAVEEAVGPLKKALAESDARIKELERRPAVVQAVQVVNQPAPAQIPPAPSPAAAVAPAAAPAPAAKAAPVNTFLKAASVAPPEPVFKDLGEDATGLVHVSVAPPPPPLPGADRDSPIPGDFQFGAEARKRRVKMLVVAILLLLVGGMVVTTIMSYRP